jgi:LuxR family transcriptional regulator, maltose regulon positive regulatory protein
MSEPPDRAGRARRPRPEHGTPDRTGTALLTSKLSPPPLGFPPLPRPRLLRQLSRGVATTPVTLLSGPAGSGKTVLAATWMQAQQGRRVGWLSLDAGDDDPAVFRPHLLAALRQTGMDLPDLPALRSGESAPEAWPTGLAAALAAQPEPVVLVLDDADSLTARELTGALDLLVRHAGARLRLVLCARADPLLPLHRYRLDERLTEIRTDELAFTAEEAGELLSALGTPVAAEVAAALQQRTEGWAAALRLAAASLAQGMDPDRLLASLAADEGSVAQYLAAEVLDHQPIQVRRFLLRISVTEQLWPELVDRLADRPGGGRVLTSLAAANAFVERAPSAPGGFRIHALFRELLQAQLAYEDPGALTAGHRTCAAWYAAAGRLPAAIEHALAADDHTLAARLLVDDLAVARLLAHGAAAARLPAVAYGPNVAVLRTAAALAERRPAGAADLGAAAAAAGDPRARPALRACAAVVCAGAAAAGPATQQVCAAAVAAETLVADLPDTQAPRRAELTAVLAASHATALLHTDAPERALRDAVGRALALSLAADAPRLSARCLADLALLEALAGRLRRATKLAADHEALADGRRLPETDRAAAAATAAAWVHLDRHELAEARRWLARAGQRASEVSTGPLRAVLESRLRRARGELDAAVHVLRPVLDTPETPGWVREQVLSEAVRIRLARRDGPAALALLDRLPPAAARAAVLRSTAAACGLLPTARGVTADGRADAGGPLPLGLAVEDAVVRACLFTDAGETATAVATLEQALELAAPERLRRPFLDAPAQLRPLLCAHPAIAAAGAWLNPTAPAIPAPRHPVDPAIRSAAPAGPPTVVGELSSREREVLQLLAEMLSTPEIAAALFVSINTVRTHIRSILRKLGVTRRNEAVRRARELHLLEPTDAPPGAAPAAIGAPEGTAM